MDNKITFKVQMMDMISYAMQQNYIPAVRSITLANNTEEPIKNVTVRINSEPEFIKPFETEISCLASGEPVEISPVRLILSSEFLFSLTEKMSASIHFTVVSEEKELCDIIKNIDLLPFDQWLGYSVIPELTAAFVLPNHPKIDEISAKAGMYLKEWTGNPSFVGYQSRNPNIVKRQIASVYAALQAENIAYRNPPASFEQVGQRIRMPYTVLEQKGGTCLDLAILFASCLESVGLNPLIMIIKGHAFCGCWLEEEIFENCAEDDISAVTKRTANGMDMLCLVECTDFTAGKNTDFDHAEKHANDHLINPSDFLMAIDIRRCRGNGIRPIPARIAENGVFTAVDYGKRNEDQITNAPREIDLSRHAAISESNTKITRETLWERKLLDLSLRNSLLNFRPNSGSVQFMTSDLATLEDAIADGESFKIMPAPSEITLALSDSKIFEIENEKDMIAAISDSEFKLHRIRTFISESQLEQILKKIHRTAKLSIEENGANTLYLALGFLRWFETDKSERPRFAPLVMIPVEIIRKIQDRSYSIRIRDEETQMNITLLEMLRQDFDIDIKGLDPLPKDEKGTDIPLIFNTIRNGVMSKRRWDIEEIAFLGQFSFSQFIMWNDIRSRSEELEQNKVVSSLISGKINWEPINRESGPHMLDDILKPSDIAVPMDADSSQLAAVYQAAQGESFVLHGPPGTGKSQTITNMIANALYNGKSVLFVAEKMAALSVVQKRLASIGLDIFCLELHSNKAQKKAVLSQLESALAVGHIKPPEEYSDTAEELLALRKELNSVMDDIHSLQPAGVSLYTAITELDKNSDYNGRINMPVELIDGIGSATTDSWRSTVRKVATSLSEHNYFSSPLKEYCRQEYSPEIREKFFTSADVLARKAETACASYKKMSGYLGISLASDLTEIKRCIELFETALQYELLPEMLVEPLTKQDILDIEELISNGKKLSAILEEQSSIYEESFYTLDCDQLKTAWKETEMKWFLPKFLGKKKLIRSLAVHVKNTASVTPQNYLDICSLLENTMNLKNSVRQSTAVPITGELWRGENTDFDQIEKAYNASVGLTQSKNYTAEYGSAIIKFISDVAVAEKIRSELNNVIDFIAYTTNMEQEYSLDLSGLNADRNYFAAVKEACIRWKENISAIRERTALENAFHELNALGLQPVVQAIKDNKVSEKDLIPSFEHSLNRIIIFNAFRNNPKLSKFQEAQFEDTIKKYRETIGRFRSLTIQELAARLSAKIPNVSVGSGGSSEVAILQKAIRSGGRMMPIRKLFDSIPNLLRRICPCMLMSPISVAQYIDPKFPKFDLVIFDEASQLPTSEAVGAIARGENVVVVGDPNQLPPTSFFSSNHIIEDNFEQEDLESLLDDCLALGMPQKHLLWHYRSRHESLITFSNAKFYDNKLLTFPSPSDQISEVKWIHVDGVYDKGRTKQNLAEAEAIISEVERRLSDEKLRCDSIGIVTFSSVQQNLIDDLMAELFMRRPELELIANEMHEPIFIKNLENVQGDERDVILFSVCYGPDKKGKISMNFGPLNRNGGWRRLNVAVSRARKCMMVYSTIRPEQIDTSRTRSEGVAYLKAFLEFAAKGRLALAISASSKTESDESFSSAIAMELSKLGYMVKCGIGCSGFRIDIAIVNPDNPNTYMLGILCDSKPLYERTTARDRNAIQPSVLKGLGWQLYNVHILDWLDNKNKVIKRIISAIETAKDNAKSQVINATVKPASEPFRLEQMKRCESVSLKTASYTPYCLQSISTPEKFYEPGSLDSITKIINSIVACEAPISRRAAMKSTLAGWGITRTGSRVEAVFDQALSKADVKKTEHGGQVYLWRKDQDPKSYDTVRISHGNSKRAIEDIAPEEIAVALRYTLSNQLSIPYSDMIRETAKLLGFTRSGTAIEHQIGFAAEIAKSSGWAETDGERITFTN